ncbi:hypothetical protein AB0E11_13625 [Streptomyces fradiae]|uniref:hypothetical protein n=1 Tax=Streptomyces fradiae TaxID=1906 RepID=UPI00340A02DB
MTTVPTGGHRAQPQTGHTAAAPFGARVAADILAQMPHLAERVTTDTLAAICTRAALQTGILTARCTMHDWCTETGEHRDHYSTYVEAPTPDGLGDPVLMAAIMSSDDKPPTIGFLDDNFTPDQTRERIAELRAHLDQVEALADQLAGVAPPEPAAETYSVHARGARGALANAEIFTSDARPLPWVAVWGEPMAEADLDVAGTDELIRDLEQFVTRLRALRNYIAAAEANR